MSRATKLIVDNLIEAFRTRPDDFVLTEFVLRDKSTNTQYWIANGISFYGTYYPAKLRFGWRQSFRFHRALSYLVAYQAAYKSEIVEPPLKVVS